VEPPGTADMEDKKKSVNSQDACSSPTEVRVERCFRHGVWTTMPLATFASILRPETGCRRGYQRVGF
jgi:hypothetical protein